MERGDIDAAAVDDRRGAAARDRVRCQPRAPLLAPVAIEEAHVAGALVRGQEAHQPAARVLDRRGGDRGDVDQRPRVAEVVDLRAALVGEEHVVRGGGQVRLAARQLARPIERAPVRRFAEVAAQRTAIRRRRHRRVGPRARARQHDGQQRQGQHDEPRARSHER